MVGYELDIAQARVSELNRKLIKAHKELDELKAERDAARAETIQTMICDVHQIAVEHGWWDEERNDAECIALMHSELSEALEAMRHGRPSDEHCKGFDNMTVELADCIIRIFDFAGARHLDLTEALKAKIEFNRTRPYKHGGKKF